MPSTGLGDFDVKTASPRYWVIWPAVLMMLIYSFAELAMNWRVIFQGFRSGALSMYAKITGREIKVFDDAIPDPAPKEQLVSPVWIVGGLAASILMTVLVCSLQFHMDAGNAILAILLAFLFAFIGVQSAGTTDINPLSSVAKASQLIVGGAVKGQGKTGDAALLENLLAGSIASSAAAHSVDMVGDLKTGHWLHASPRAQFWAQLWGSLWATPLSVGLYVLFSKAYPCINDSSIENCEFGTPSVAAWTAVAQVVVAKDLPISLSSGLTAIFMSIVAALTIFLKYKVIPAKYHVFLPNWNSVGIGMLVPNTNYVSQAMMKTFPSIHSPQSMSCLTAGYCYGHWSALCPFLGEEVSEKCRLVCLCYRCRICRRGRYCWSHQRYPADCKCPTLRLWDQRRSPALAALRGVFSRRMSHIFCLTSQMHCVHEDHL